MGDKLKGQVDSESASDYHHPRFQSPRNKMAVNPDEHWSMVSFLQKKPYIFGPEKSDSEF